MKKKRLAAVAVALALVLSLSVSALALNGIGIGDFLQIVSSIDTSKYTEYNEQQWTTMTPAERAEQFNFVISDQKGTSRITENSDFINDSALSYKYYCGLVNNSLINQGLNNNLYSKTYLEFNGLADFGMGYYGLNGNGHSSGKFGDGTVADTLNDDFLDYMQKNPYSGIGSSNRYQFSNGYYVDYEPLLLGPYRLSSPAYYSIDVDGVTHNPIAYGLQFYLHDDTGKIIDIYKLTANGAYAYPLVACDVCNVPLFSNFTITENGKFYFDDHNRWTYNRSDPQHVYYYTNFSEKSSEYDFPWWDKYGAVDEEEPPLFPAVGVDDDGNQIKLNVTSDGITYEGNTYQIDNSDHSVTIDGNKYYITVNPSDVDENYYNDFLQQVINNYYNYYNTDSKPFDGTDILTAIKSVFTSLETFRSYCYSQLKQIGNYIVDGFNSMRSSLKTIIDKLDKLKDIIKQLKDISGTLEEISEEQKQEYSTKWLEAIGKVKKKFCYDEIKANIDNCYNAMFNAEYTETEQAEVIATYAYNDGSGAEPIKKNGTFLPAITVEIFGQEYNLLSCIGSFTPYMDGIKDIISMFLIITFVISLFRSLPAMIGGVSSVVTSTPQFQDFSDKTEVEFYRSKYDR